MIFQNCLNHLEACLANKKHPWGLQTRSWEGVSLWDGPGCIAGKMIRQSNIALGAEGFKSCLSRCNTPGNLSAQPPCHQGGWHSQVCPGLVGLASGQVHLSGRCGEGAREGVCASLRWHGVPGITKEIKTKQNHSLGVPTKLRSDESKKKI